MEPIKDVLSSHTMASAVAEPTVQKKFSRSKLLVTIVLVVIVFLFILYIVSNTTLYYSVVRTMGKGEVVERVISNELLDFGDLSIGASVVRKVDLENNSPMPIRVIIFRTGDIKEYILINKNLVRMSAHTLDDVELTLFLPQSLEEDLIITGRVFILTLPFI